MSLFVEVFSVPKGVNVIINLDEVVEIAPLPDGSAALFFKDGSGSGSMTSITVRQAVSGIDVDEDEVYGTFKQFVVQTVSSNDIARRIASLTKSAPSEFPGFELPDDEDESPLEPPRNKGGRPRKNP